MLLFKLSMPNVGSWNGRWSGEGKVYVKTRKLSVKKENELDGCGFYYNFGDGWGASIDVKKMPAAVARKIMLNSKGFCGYDWMIDSILKYGDIYNSEQRNAIEDAKAKGIS